MRIAQLLGLVAMPLVAAMPAATLPDAHEAGAHLDRRATFLDTSQFDFAPFNLTNIGMECARPSATDLYSCELRCKLPVPSHGSSIC